MKKFVLVLKIGILLLIGSAAFGQRLGFKAGLNLSSQQFIFDGDKLIDEPGVTQSPNVGFVLGPLVDYSFMDRFALESGILVTKKGSNYHQETQEAGRTYESDLIVNAYYLNVPILAKLKFEVGTVDIYAGLGPSLNFGMTGEIKTKFKSPEFSENNSDDINWGDDSENDHLKRFDLGVLFAAGVEYKIFQFGLGYEIGATNALPGGDSKNSIRNQNGTISAAVFLDRKK